ncbi:MAG: glutathione S-transferase family protein, partial [Planctomycetota bacterium]
LHEIPPSPNSMKVRIALNYKGIAFERIPLQMTPGVPPSQSDRSVLIELSRQPFAPVLVHGSVRMFDSSAILRYLEANFPDTPPIFSTVYPIAREMEAWEKIGRTECIAPVGIVFGQAFSDTPDPTECQRACQIAHEASAPIEERLKGSEWLVGDHLSIADIVCAPPLFYGMISDEAAKASPIAAFFKKSLDLGPDRERTRAWVAKVMAFDR